MPDRIDILNRQPIVDKLIDLIHIIANNGNGCTFSLDGKWGSGKSFVLEMFEKQISLFQDPNAAGDKYVVFHYNCWQYDFYDEPAIAIVAAIKNEISKYNSVLPQLPPTINAALKTAGNIGKELLRGVIEAKLGHDPISIVETIHSQKDSIEKESSDDNAFDNYFKFKEILDLTKKQLSKISSEKPVILVVDELDRCMPSYAIKVLERLHHLFDNNSNIIVIIAVDKEQLTRTVHQIFGIDSNDSGKHICADYLKKFINFSVSLDAGEITNDFWDKYAHIMHDYTIGNDFRLLESLPNKLFAGLDIRTQEQAMGQLTTLHKLSFGHNNCSSVLIFELIYQAITARHSTFENLSWLIQNQSKNSFVENAIGSSLWQNLKDFKIQATSSTKRIVSSGRGPREFSIFENTPLGVAFWMIASLSEIGEIKECYENHIIDNAVQYKHLVECAQTYHQLAKLIK